MFAFNTLPELFQHIQGNIKMPSYLNYRKNERWESISSTAFTEMVTRLSKSFKSVGVSKGTTVGIVSPSSPFWLMVDFALQKLGAVSVPIFANITNENLIYQIQDADIHFLYVADVEENKTLQSVMASMQCVVLGDAMTDHNSANIFSWDAFLTLGTDGIEDHTSVSPDDIATIIYTSGSTGQPKGVELSHKNITVQLHDASVAIPLQKSDVILSLLPLAHIFERMVMYYYLASGVTIYFVDHVERVGEYIRQVRPSAMLVVPRLLEKIYAKIHMNVESAPYIKRMVASVAFWWARVRDPDQQKRGLIDTVMDKLVYQKLLDSLGGHLRLVICGGAPLSKPISKFFLNIGMPLYQGYGLSESSPVISVNRVNANRWGSSGLTFEHVEVKIADNGELLARGENVMRGYHNRPDETAAAIDNDGWLHTGDLASIDADGFITIESRLTEVVKTSTGKFVSTVKIESALMHSKWIEYAMVVAESRPYVSALIFIDPATPSLVHKDTHRTIIDQRVKAVNKHLNKWEKIGDYLIIYELPSIENELITPSMKIIRNHVMDRYRDKIEMIYQKKGRS